MDSSGVSPKGLLKKWITDGDKGLPSRLSIDFTSNDVSLKASGALTAASDNELLFEFSGGGLRLPIVGARLDLLDPEDPALTILLAGLKTRAVVGLLVSFPPDSDKSDVRCELLELKTFAEE
jgi:hypothetical protein